ncbi:MAG: hypothetical protein HUN04_01905 [Desulfobacter sp.]|nr:MAG: hypothetical protein HUN04_01905 [Desulfobacter sp.]
MMKKKLVILMVILAVAVFGTVSSARAFIDPVSLSVILGTVMIVLVTGAEIHYAKEDKDVVKAEVVVTQAADAGEVKDRGRPLTKK